MGNIWRFDCAFFGIVSLSADVRELFQPLKMKDGVPRMTIKWGALISLESHNSRF